MADYYPANITIGGVLTALGRIKLARAIDEDRAPLEFGGRPLNRERAIKAINEAVARNLPLELVDDKARGGCFENVEQACRDLTLPFSRTSEAAFGEDGDGVSFDGTTEKWYQAAGGGTAVLPVSELKKALDEGTIANLVNTAYELENAVIPKLELATPDAGKSAVCGICDDTIVRGRSTGEWIHAGDDVCGGNAALDADHHAVADQEKTIP